MPIRKLPKLKGKKTYTGPDGADLALMHKSDSFALWAEVNMVQDAQDPMKNAVVRVVRVKTHEVESTKWVEFCVAPSALLVNGAPYFDLEEFEDAKVLCEWSDFLRLTRWRKTVADFTPREQALIARLEYALGPSRGCRFVLTAVDHPIRKGVK